MLAAVGNWNLPAGIKATRPPEKHNSIEQSALPPDVRRCEAVALPSRSVARFAWAVPLVESVGKKTLRNLGVSAVEFCLNSPRRRRVRRGCAESFFRQTLVRASPLTITVAWMA